MINYDPNDELLDGLTKKQLKAIDLLFTFVDSDEKVFRLSGVAGSGKTFVINVFLQLFRKRGCYGSTIAAIAPTNKAKKVLKIEGVTSRTISSFLGLEPQMDLNGGKISFRRKDKLQEIEPCDYDLVICDEYSMIGRDNVNLLIRECRKIIFLGDYAQLPPIGESIPLVAELDCPSIELNEVVRYSGDLAIVAHSWRDSPPIKFYDATIKVIRTNPLPIEQTRDDTIESFSKLKWVDRFTGLMRTAISTNNPDIAKIITYRNIAADKWNSWVRSELFENDSPYNPNDLLVAKKPLFRYSPQKTSKAPQLQLACENSAEFHVIGLNYATTESHYGEDYTHYSVQARYDTHVVTLQILDEASKLKRDAKLEALLRLQKTEKDYTKKKARWEQYHFLNQYWDDVAYNYAITAHKSQGSTYQETFLDLNDLYRCSDKKKIVYTALTRSKKVNIFA